MPNTPDRATRTRLADDLQGATPEMLREDAAALIPWAAAFANSGQAGRYHRLAALALAVAEMQERAQKEAGEAGWDPADVRWKVHRDGDASWLDSHQHGYRPRALPAALASLLREGA